MTERKRGGAERLPFFCAYPSDRLIPAHPRIPITLARRLRRDPRASLSGRPSLRSTYARHSPRLALLAQTDRYRGEGGASP
jgi:hypothetical protein